MSRPTIKSVAKFMYPSLETSTNEICFYYAEKIWTNETYHNPTNKQCSHNYGFQPVMGHIHPLRNTNHHEETNYYPSCPDIISPVIHPQNKINCTLTPIGLFIAEYELDGYKQLNTRDVYNLLCSELDGSFHALHTLTMNMRAGLSLSEVRRLVTPNLITYIDSMCENIEMAVNKYLIYDYGFPKDFPFSLRYIDIHRIHRSR
jgi:hypothetical protein